MNRPHPRLPFVLWLTVLASAPGRACSGPATEAAVRPRFRDSSIELDGKSIQPSAVEIPFREERLAGGTERVAYLVGYQKGLEGREGIPDSPARLRRLDLGTGKWLADLPVGGPAEKRSILAVLTGEGQVVVLDALEMERPDWHPVAESYQVSSFREGESKPAWIRSFPSTGSSPRAGGLLRARREPEYAASEPRRLAWLDDLVLVTAEAVQPIRALSADTGIEVWKVERLWEFHRGFTGPSVWSHHLGRFGMSWSDRDREKEERARSAFDRTFRCALIGGPAVIRLTGARGSDSHRVFVAVTRGPSEWFAGYLSDCLLYELNEKGKIISLVTLPQVVRGSLFQVQEDGVVWRCQNDGLLKVLPTMVSEIPSFGPGGPDLLTRLAWFRQLSPRLPEARVTTDRHGDPVAFSGSRAYCLPGGGFITREEPSVCRFPVSVVDLESGIDLCFFLRVPFDGEWKEPEKLLAVTGLEVEGGSLKVVLGTHTEAAGLRFDLGQIDRPRLIGASEAGVEAPVSPERVNREHEEGSTPLMEAATQSDPRRVLALLEAGADVKARTKSGRTALLAAAGSGSAEVVKLLIDAGSELEARDAIDDPTALLLAAWNGREPKRKVKHLLEAGADLKATDGRGWNALMVAAIQGNLTTVEYLVARGLEGNHRAHDGLTALMVSSGYEGGGSLVEVLVKAGTDVNARDREGMTPLMHASDGVETTAKVKALLDAGADPFLKDMKGRTALDIARRSQAMGARGVVELLEKSRRRR